VTECGELTIDGVKRLLQNGMVVNHHDCWRYERGEVETAKKISAFEAKKMAQWVMLANYDLQHGT
jgi:hypothetical protein